MKAKFLSLGIIALLAIGGAIYGFTTKGGDEKAALETCPKKGQPDCPLVQNCPRKGQADCPLVNGEQTTAEKELANCPLAGTPDCPLIKNCSKKGTDDCPYAKSNENSLANNTAKNEDLPPCCRKKAGAH